MELSSTKDELVEDVGDVDSDGGGGGANGITVGVFATASCSPGASVCVDSGASVFVSTSAEMVGENIGRCGDAGGDSGADDSGGLGVTRSSESGDSGGSGDDPSTIPSLLLSSSSCPCAGHCCAGRDRDGGGDDAGIVSSLLLLLLLRCWFGLWLSVALSPTISSGCIRKRGLVGCSAEGGGGLLACCGSDLLVPAVGSGSRILLIHR